MRRPRLAILWLATALAAAGYCGWQTTKGLPLETDLAALFPATERPSAERQALTPIARALSNRILILVGHPDEAAASRAAAQLEAALIAEGGFVANPLPDPQKLAQLYAAHRGGLLARADIEALASGNMAAIEDRALAQIYGLVGFGDAGLLMQDPFLLLPAFLAELPKETGLTIEEGRLGTLAEGLHWRLIAGRLADRGPDAGADAQPLLVATYERAANALQVADAALQLKATGAAFFAVAATRQGIGEMSWIGGGAMVGVLLLLILAFRHWQPVTLSLLSIAVGIMVALSACLLLFERVHVVALVIGTSLIGISVDYSLHYFAQAFSQDLAPEKRLARVSSGLWLGLATSLVGYVAMALSPFPGFRQLALFSAVGLTAAFITVRLWFPLLDRLPSRALPRRLANAILGLDRLWSGALVRRTAARRRLALLAILGVLILLGFGLVRLEIDDDIRNQQTLPRDLLERQSEIAALIGYAEAPQFIAVLAPDHETALRNIEALQPTLSDLAARGALAGWRSSADFLPSLARQEAAYRLRVERLEPSLPAYLARLGMNAEAATGARTAFDPITPAIALASGAMPFLSELVIDRSDGTVIHIVSLAGVADGQAIAEALRDKPEAIWVDPAADFSSVLEHYRRQALWLLAISAGLFMPILYWRYGAMGAIRVVAPPLAAGAIAVAMLGLLGQPFTFFSAMALILVLSIGIDYSIFCAERESAEEAPTILALALAASTTILAFGLLAFSSGAGLRSFGLVILCGIAAAMLMAPIARPRHRPQAIEDRR